MSEDRFNPWLHRYYERFSPRGEVGGLNSVAFLIGSPDISGGTYVIFQHALWLKEHGVGVTIVPLFPLESAAADWHPALSELEFASFEEVAGNRFDLAIATWWRTVYELPRLRFRHAAYFVQSMEPRLEVEHSPAETGLAELTYTFGLPMITIALWMQAYLAFQHQAPSFLVRNGIDKDLFSPDGPAESPRSEGRFRLLVEGAVEPEMKGVKRAIQLAKEAGCEEVWLLTPSDIDGFEEADRVFSRLSVDQLGTIYRSCDALLKLSEVEGMYGPPLEMFHCGGTLITNDVTGHDEFVTHESNGIVVPMGDDDATISAIERLRTEPGLREALMEGASSTASEWPSWEQSSRDFGRVLSVIARQPAQDLSPLCRELLGAARLDETLRP